MRKRRQRALQIYLPTCIALRKIMPLFSSCHASRKAIQSPCGTVTQTHTHTHTHTHTRARTHTHFFWNHEKDRVVLFFLSLFSFFLMLMSISCVTCHSSHLFIMWYPGTNTHTHTHTHTHTAITFARASLHWDLCSGQCAMISAPCCQRLLWCSRISFLGAAFILIQFHLGSLLPFSLPNTVSFSQVNPPGYYWLLQHSGT